MSLRKNLFFTVIAAVSMLYGCTNNSKSDKNISVTRDVFAMDTYMNLKAYGKNGESAIDEAEKRIYELENELSATLQTSDIWKINHACGAETAINDDTALLIAKALDIGESTHGALDITIFPVLKEWGFTTGKYHIPNNSKIDSLLENVDYSKIKLVENNVSIPESSEIDLGALAKGYTGDEIMKIFRSYNIDSAIVSLGGNVQALGSKPDGSSWKVAVRDPYSPEMDMCVVEVNNKAVITSGNYERLFTGDDGSRYWHIIDPADGYPADNGFVSVTVIGENGLNCDCLSTAIFVAGLGGYKDIIKDYPSYDFVFVTDDKKILYTSGITDKFQNISSMTAEVINID
ncbi:FAD:protein FMN transferase [Ruminococcus sp.]|uniref:FAD:protein FMN transferase n=1 Tax=Ruminococcus sp. TaxID=41978 RepID=UPI0025E4A3BF|nr:FAD:protein FMN transferase [Ruminococcus sp.]MCR4637861.1 FAD:protein FMN transferase [Ruminococcus sp.]